MVELTQDEFTALFAEYPAVRKADSGSPICPYCSNALSPESIDLMNGSTEDGTPYCTVEITCDVCGKDIWRGGSWHGDAISHEERVKTPCHLSRRKLMSGTTLKTVSPNCHQLDAANRAQCAKPRAKPCSMRETSLDSAPKT
jgi:hypothetical protein